MVGACTGDKLDQVAFRHPFQNRDVAYHLRHACDRGCRYRLGAHAPRPRRGRLRGRQNTACRTNNPVGNDGKFLGKRRPVGRRTGRQVGLGSQSPGAAGNSKPGRAAQGARRSSTAIRTAGATRRRSSSAPRPSGSSAWRTSRRGDADLRWIAERAVDETQFFPAWGRAAWRR